MRSKCLSKWIQRRTWQSGHKNIKLDNLCPVWGPVVILIMLSLVGCGACPASLTPNTRDSCELAYQVTFLSAKWYDRLPDISVTHWLGQEMYHLCKIDQKANIDWMRMWLRSPVICWRLNCGPACSVADFFQCVKSSISFSLKMKLNRNSLTRYCWWNKSFESEQWNICSFIPKLFSSPNKLKLKQNKVVLFYTVFATAGYHSDQKCSVSARYAHWRHYVIEWVA